MLVAGRLWLGMGGLESGLEHADNRQLCARYGRVSLKIKFLFALPGLLDSL